MQVSTQEISHSFPSPILNRSSPYDPITLSKFKIMWGKKIGSMKKLAKKGKTIKKVVQGDQISQKHEYLLLDDFEGEGSSSSSSSASSTPIGTFALYVGEDRRRFIVPTGYLSHPLFKMLLEKAHNEFGFDQRNGLVVPCSVTTFREVVSAVECCNGKFDFGDLVQEFI